MVRGARAFAFCVGADIRLSPDGKADQHGDESAPAKPVQRGQSQILKNLGFGGGIHLLHEWDVDEVEEIEQADPGDAGQKMEPAQDELSSFLAGDGGQNQSRCRGDEMMHGFPPQV